MGHLRDSVFLSPPHQECEPGREAEQPVFLLWVHLWGCWTPRMRLHCRPRSQQEFLTDTATVFSVVYTTLSRRGTSVHPRVSRWELTAIQDTQSFVK